MTWCRIPYESCGEKCNTRSEGSRITSSPQSPVRSKSGPAKEATYIVGHVISCGDVTHLQTANVRPCKMATN